MLPKVCEGVELKVGGDELGVGEAEKVAKIQEIAAQVDESNC